MRWWDGRVWTQQIAASAAPGLPSAPGFAPSPYPSYQPAPSAGRYPMPYSAAGVTAAMQTPGFDGLSIASLIAGLLGVWFVGLPLGIAGIVWTKRHIRRGRGMAIAGVVASVLWLSVAASLVIAGVVADTSSDAAATPPTVRVPTSALRTDLSIVLPDKVADDPRWLDTIYQAVDTMVDTRCDTSLVVLSGSSSSVLDTVAGSG